MLVALQLERQNEVEGHIDLKLGFELCVNVCCRVRSRPRILLIVTNA